MTPLRFFVITLLYATVSGRALQLASIARDRLSSLGYLAETESLAGFPASRLLQLENAWIIASCWGEGAPPPDCLEFIHAIEAPKLRLPKLRYTVLALGNLSHGRPSIGTGWRIDSALAARGAKRLLPRHECCRDDTSGFDHWFDSATLALNSEESVQLPFLKLA